MTAALRHRIGLGVIALLALGSALSESGAQPARPAFPDIIAPGLVLSFEGGQPGDTIAEVLGVLRTSKSLLRQPGLATTTHTVQSGNSICQILADANYPLPCSGTILNLVELLNPDSQPIKNGLKVKQDVVIPAPDLYKYSVTRIFREGAAGRTEADDILKNWKRVNAREVKDSNQLQIQYDAYRMFVGTKGDEASFALATELAKVVKDSANLKLDVILRSPTEKQHSPFPTTALEWEQRCLAGRLFSTAMFYRDMSQIDKEALAVVQKAKAASVASVPVHIVDIALNSSPAFSPAPPPGQLPCMWTTYIPAHHHSTHMKAIIASRHTQLGFVGLAPDADVDVFEWLKAKGNVVEESSKTRAFRLSDMLSATSADKRMHVYLIATTFPQSASKANQAVDRFREALATRIQQTANLFVIAAGQDASKPGVELSPKNDISPQNLGDLSNVIVVTACNPCTRDHARLMPEANYSQPIEGKSFVHVAAPGGGAIAGWVSSQHVAAAVGTSQATAYVTGVVAAMLGRYKEDYRTPEIVKRRIQVTSQPTSWPSDDTTKLAAGTVDPVLAMLDPSQHWVKRSGEWEAIPIKSLTTAANGMITFSDGTNGVARDIYHRSALRFVRTVEGSAADRRWEIYQEQSKAFPTKYLPAVINRVKDLVPTGEPIVLCNNTKIAWSDISDLIIAEGGVDAKACTKK